MLAGSTIRGQKKSVQVNMNVKSPSTAAPGRAAGTATCQNVRSIEQPSTRADSISSSGRASTRYWRMKNTPKAETRAGTMTAQTDPVHPSLAIMMNSGMTPSWVGIAKVATTKTISASRPRKRSLAKAKPARVEKKTTEAVTTEETSTLLSSAFQNSTVSKTREAFSRKLPPGSSGGSRWFITSASCEPTRKDQ